MKTTLSALALFGVLFACGGGDSGGGGNAVVITANDAMQFNKRAFQVTLGDTVSITLKNVGSMPVETMGHNLVILKPGSDRNKFGLAGAEAKDNGYIPPKYQDWVVLKTGLLGPGQEETIEFTPTEAGEYPYLCTFPGHVATMKGTIIVGK